MKKLVVLSSLSLMGLVALQGCGKVNNSHATDDTTQAQTQADEKVIDKNQADIQAADAQIGAQQKQIDSFNTRIAELTKQLADAQNQLKADEASGEKGLSDLQSKIDSLTTSISQLTGEVGGLTNLIAKANSKIKEADKQIDQIKKEDHKLQSEIDSNTQLISQVNSDLDDLSSHVEDVRADLQQKITDLQIQLNDVVSKLAPQDKAQKIYQNYLSSYVSPSLQIETTYYVTTITPASKDDKGNVINPESKTTKSYTADFQGTIQIWNANNISADNKSVGTFTIYNSKTDANADQKNYLPMNPAFVQYASNDDDGLNVNKPIIFNKGFDGGDTFTMKEIYGDNVLNADGTDSGKKPDLINVAVIQAQFSDAILSETDASKNDYLAAFIKLHPTKQIADIINDMKAMKFYVYDVKAAAGSTTQINGQNQTEVYYSYLGDMKKEDFVATKD